MRKTKFVSRKETEGREHGTKDCLDNGIAKERMDVGGGCSKVERSRTGGR